eukprot:UC1_evm1s158
MDRRRNARVIVCGVRILLEGEEHVPAAEVTALANLHVAENFVRRVLAEIETLEATLNRHKRAIRRYGVTGRSYRNMPTFNPFVEFDDGMFELTFKFTKTEFNALMQQLPLLADHIRAGQRGGIYPIGTCLLITLDRMISYLSFADMAHRWRIRHTTLCKIFKATVNAVHAAYGNIVRGMDVLRIHDYIETWMDCAVQFSTSKFGQARSIIDGVFGFIDGKYWPCESVQDMAEYDQIDASGVQEVWHGGRLHGHGLNVQHLISLEGIICCVCCDSTCLNDVHNMKKSRVEPMLAVINEIARREQAERAPAAVFGDKAYPLIVEPTPCCYPFPRKMLWLRMDEEERQLYQDTNAWRNTVEQSFRMVTETFTGLNCVSKWQLFQDGNESHPAEMEKIWQVAVFFRNLITCTRTGNSATSQTGIKPPTVEEYLHNYHNGHFPVPEEFPLPEEGGQGEEGQGEGEEGE